MKGFLALAFLVVGMLPGVARPPDHYASIGWMDESDLDCEESAQNPFAPSDHICTVRYFADRADFAYVYDSSKADVPKFKIAARTRVWNQDEDLDTHRKMVALILRNSSCHVATAGKTPKVIDMKQPPKMPVVSARCP